MNAKVKRSRIWELDFFRGLSILLVVIDHAMYDFSGVFSFWASSGSKFLRFLNATGTAYLSSDVRFLWRPAFLFIFFFTSGLCTAFSRNNFLRGLRLCIVAAVISVSTYLADRLFGTSVYAMFGVIHCIATVILIYACVDFIIRFIPKIYSKIAKKEAKPQFERILHIVICLAIGVACCFINKKYNVSLHEVNGNFTAIDTDSKILGLFFYCDNWWTADYFPLIPFVSFFFMGAIVGKTLYRDKKTKLPLLAGVWHTPITFVGRHSLVVYLGGQVFFILLGLLLTNIL